MSSTTVQSNQYVAVLDNNTVLYVPSCLLVQLLARSCSQMSMINMAGDIRTVVSDMNALQEQLAAAFLAMQRALTQSQAKFFPGDWKRDKQEARALLYKIITRIAYICEIVGAEDRKRILAVAKRMTETWANLVRVMDMRCREAGGTTMLECRQNRYYRSEKPATGTTDMARLIKSLHTATEYPTPETRLLLVCYKRVRQALIGAIGELERKSSAPQRFNPEKILCVFDNDLPITCPNCTRMTGASSSKTRTAIRSSYLRRHREDTHRRRERARGQETVIMDPPRPRRKFEE